MRHTESCHIRSVECRRVQFKVAGDFSRPTASENGSSGVSILAGNQ